MEGLPLKYIAILLAATIVIAAILQVTNTLTTSASQATQAANSTLINILDNSLENVLNKTIS